MIKRNEYLEQLKLHRDNDVIKVVTGVRRCGKSTLFALYQDYLKEDGIKDEQIISLNLEDLEYEELLDYKKLYSYITSKLQAKTYVFIDEVQNCKNFEKAVDSLLLKDNVDIYITGSNAYMLSGELATLLSGRYIKIDMLPLSFKEYYSVKQPQNIENAFNDYLKFGSFPFVATSLQDERAINDYLEGIYSTILIKDVAKREEISHVGLLESILKTVAHSVGSPISTNKITNTLLSLGRKISVNTVDNYMKALSDAYIFYKADRFDIKGRQHLKTLGKFYLVDTGIRNFILSSQSKDLGHNIENVVYLELLRRGYKVNIGKLGNKEVDFVARKHDDTLYIQVSASVLDENTLNRELSPLNAISDHYSKLLLTLDNIGNGSNYNGIKQQNLIDWLME